MAEDAIVKAGLYFDELNKIRVLDPEVTVQTNELKDECKDFLDKMTHFQKIVGSFIQHIDSVGNEVEKEKLKAIASRNQLKSVSKQREAQQQQLHALITEKRMQLERLRIQYDALAKQEREQTEFIEQLVLQK
jgi:intraflagellar transport protein 20